MNDTIKEFRDEHPILDFAVGFVPGVGEALDAHDFYHAAKDGDWGTMALTSLGLIIPGLTGGQITKGIKFLKNAVNSGKKTKKAEKAAKTTKPVYAAPKKSLTRRIAINAGPEIVLGGIGAGAGYAIDNAAGGDGTIGGIVGGLAGVGTTRRLFSRARKAAYRHITPLGYNDAGNLGLGKKQEIKNMLKETFSFSKQPTTGIMPWIANLNINRNASVLNTNGFTTGAYVRFRDQAWRKALKQPQLSFEPQVYKLNPDGITYSYDLDAVNKIRKDTGSKIIDNPTASDLDTLYINGQRAKADVITANGGYVGVIKDAAGNEYMIDTWDLQPFKDDFRSLWPWGTKHLPFIKNLEIIELMRGNPFTVVHKLEQPNYEVYN